ncbi:hypothetical protein BDV06DRAFT_199794 [Aspergillus oleicola]
MRSISVWVELCHVRQRGAPLRSSVFGRTSDPRISAQRFCLKPIAMLFLGSGSTVQVTIGPSWTVRCVSQHTQVSIRRIEQRAESAERKGIWCFSSCTYIYRLCVVN